MADLQKTIEIVFEGVDNTSSVIDAVGSDLDALSGNVQQATGPLADITTSLLAVEAAAAGVGLAFAALSVQAAGEFSDSFNEIATLTEASDEALAQYKQELLDYASTSSQSFEQITGATYSAVSAGIDYGESVEFVSEAERLAVASKADLNETTVLLASTLNAFGASAEDAARYSDILFTTVRTGQTTLPELASSLAQVSSTAEAAGVPIETIAAAVADLTAKGMPTSQAITSIKAALSNIIKPSTEAQEAASALGVEFSVTALETKGLEGLLTELDHATGGNVDQMAKFFGSTEALNAVMALSQDEASGFIEKLDAMENSSGAVEAAYSKMADNFELVNQRMRNAVEAFLTESGAPLEERWSEIGSAVSGIFLALRDSVDEGAFDEIYAVIDQFITDAVADIEAMAEALPEALAGVEFSGFLEALGGLGDEIAGLFDGVDLTTPEGLESAIQGLVDIGEGLIDVTSGIVRGFDPFVDALVNAVDGFKDLSPEAKDAAGQLLGLATGLDKVLGLADGAVGALQGISGALGVIAASNAVKTIRDLSGAMPGLTTNAGLLSKAIGGIGAAWAGWEVGRWIADVTGLDQAIDDLANEVNDAGETVGPAADKFDSLDDRLADITERTGVTVTSMEEFNQAIESGALVWDDASQKWVQAGDALRDFDAEVQAAAGTSDELLLTAEELQAAMGPVSDLLGEGATNAGEFGEQTGEAAEETGALYRIIRDANGEIIGYEQAMGSAGSTTDAAAESMTKAAQASEEFRMKMAELASDERIANIEASVDINVAQIEADTKRAEAAFDGLARTIESTGDVVSTLYGAYVGADRMDQIQLEAWIEEENERRDKALEAQLELTEAEKRLINARAALIEQGGGEIQVTAEGLEPALESIMFQVIDKVRVQIATSYDDFLLACPSGT